jgi:hypothetical protein
LTYNSSTGVLTSSITQYTDALARASISITTTGTSGASTYNSTTGVLNVPQYQGVITLTTTGTSGAATFSSNTLNIPQYQAVLTNPVTGTGTSGYHAKWTSSSVIGNGLIYDTGANIGINTTSPSVNSNQTSLTINGTNVSRIDMQVSGTRNAGFVAASDAAYLETTAANPLVFITNSVERMRINSNGNVGIGVVPQTWYAGTAALQFSTGGALWSTGGGNIILSGNEYLDTAGNPKYLNTDNACRYQQNAGQHRFSTAPAGTAGNTSSYTERMRIFENGNTAIGTSTDNGYKLYVSGTIYATGNITANSDLTLKKNLTIIENPIDKLMQLNGYAYQWKSDDSHQYGVIAQEVEKILPYAVSTGNDGIKGVSYNQIIPVLIEAVKEQKKELEELRNILASK